VPDPGAELVDEQQKLLHMDELAQTKQPSGTRRMAGSVDDV
jgi:hypothetical protein